MGGEEKIKKHITESGHPSLRSYDTYRRLLEQYVTSKYPGTTLPEVTLLIRDETEHFANALIQSTDEPWTGGGKVYIGNASLTFNQEEQTAFLKFITLYDPWRNDERKFGYASYLALIQYLLEKKHRGDEKSPPLRLISGHSLSRASHALWKGFVTAGIARMVGEEVVNEDARDSSYSTTKFELI